VGAAVSLHRKTRKLTLGAVADHDAPGLTDALTLAGARKAAAAAKHLVEQGIDPAAQKQAAKANSIALAAQRAADGVEPHAEQFLRLYARPNTRPRTYQQTEDVLRRLVLPNWRGRTVHDIKRRDVIALLDDIAGERGPHMANKTLGVLGRWFSWLVGRDVVAVSPCLGVERPARDIPRERTLDDREIVALWRACGEEGVFGAFVRILLLTGCRRAEAAAMRWSELDEAQRLWSLPRERVKNGVPHVVPLAPQAWAIVAAQPRFVGSEFVFSNDGRRPIGGFSRSKHKLDERMKPAAPWCLHDAAQPQPRAGPNNGGQPSKRRSVQHRRANAGGQFRLSLVMRIAESPAYTSATRCWRQGAKPSRSTRPAKARAMGRAPTCPTAYVAEAAVSVIKLKPRVASANGKARGGGGNGAKTKPVLLVDPNHHAPAAPSCSGLRILKSNESMSAEKMAMFRLPR
jgi:integrase